MSQTEIPSSPVADVATPDDSEVARVLDQYLAGIEAGRAADPERLLAEHPALAGQLRACLEVMQFAERLASSSNSGSWTHRLDSKAKFQGLSAFISVGFGSGSVPRVHLRDLPDELEQVIKLRSVEMPATDGVNVGRYQIHGEIARGGMGAILKGRDVDLGRELAIKVLLESHRGQPRDRAAGSSKRLRSAASLQHPGIAPVFEVGTFPDPDCRPYFAMKLVKGQTLAALLKERTDPTHDLPRFLAIFGQVCQTMAYAHAAG